MKLSGHTHCQKFTKKTLSTQFHHPLPVLASDLEIAQTKHIC